MLLYAFTHIVFTPHRLSIGVVETPQDLLLGCHRIGLIEERKYVVYLPLALSVTIVVPVHTILEVPL